MEQYIYLIWAAGGAALGILITWLISRSKIAAAFEKAKNELGVKQGVLEEKLQSANQDIEELKSENESLEKELEISLKELKEISVEKAALEQDTKRIKPLEEEIKSSKEEMKSLNGQLSDLREKYAEIKTQREEENRAAQEKIRLLDEAKEKLTESFENLANKIFEEKSKSFSEQSKSNLETMLNPLREQLGDFRKKVEDVYEKETRERTSLETIIKEMRHQAAEFGEKADNLADALKGDKKAQGSWGEFILEKVLEKSGLKKGREYEVQVSLKSSEGQRYQPDVIVRLPDEKDVVIDSKVSLVAYEKYYNSNDDDEREKALNQHVASIKNHIKGLSEKNYEELEGIRSLEMVLMFIPIESAFRAAVEQDLNLFTEGFDKKVILVSPSTLLVTLRTIESIWRYEYQNKNAQEIAKRGADLYDKFVLFIEALEDVGKNIEKAQEAYETAHNRIKTGKGNLIYQTQKLRELGLRTSKDLPQNLLDSAEDLE